jgi:hypothetical protein
MLHCKQVHLSGVFLRGQKRYTSEIKCAVVKDKLEGKLTEILW